MIGFNSFLIKVMGWWAFDVFTTLASEIGQNKYTAGQTILRNVGLFTYMIPVGLSQSTSYIVGKYIGRGQTLNAQKSYYLCMTVSFIWSVFSMVLVYMLEDQI